MPGLLAGIKLPSAAMGPGSSGSSDSGSDSEPVFSTRNIGTKKSTAAAGGSDDLIAWMAAEAARLASPERSRRPPQASELQARQRLTSLNGQGDQPQPEVEPEPELEPELGPDPELLQSSTASKWLTEERKRIEAEQETQGKQIHTASSPAAKQLAQDMSDAALAEATHQQASQDKSHLPAWLRSSGVKIAAHRLHVKSTVKNVNKLQVEVDRLKASHMLFSDTDWPAGTLWNPDGERKERTPPPCPMDLLPDEILMGVLTSVRRAKTLLNLSQCCTRLRRLADEEPYLWRRLCEHCPCGK